MLAAAITPPFRCHADAAIFAAAATPCTRVGAPHDAVFIDACRYAPRHYFDTYAIFFHIDSHAARAILRAFAPLSIPVKSGTAEWHAAAALPAVCHDIFDATPFRFRLITLLAFDAATRDAAMI